MDYAVESVDDCFRGLGFTAVMHTFCWRCARSSPPIVIYSCVDWFMQTLQAIFEGKPYCLMCRAHFAPAQLTQAMYFLRILRIWQHYENYRHSMERGYGGRLTHRRTIGEVMRAGFYASQSSQSNAVIRYQLLPEYLASCADFIQNSDHLADFIACDADYTRPIRSPDQIPPAAFRPLEVLPGSPPIARWDPLEEADWPRHLRDMQLHTRRCMQEGSDFNLCY